MRKRVLLGLAVGIVLALVLSGCSQDAIIGKWNLQGSAPKTDSPASATFKPVEAPAFVTFSADGKHVTSKGKESTWKRTGKDTVDVGKVHMQVVINGNDMYLTIGDVTQHWTKATQ
jgi:hypothetical protein